MGGASGRDAVRGARSRRALARTTPHRGHSGVETAVAPQRGQSMGRAVAHERRPPYTNRLSFPSAGTQERRPREDGEPAREDRVGSDAEPCGGGAHEAGDGSRRRGWPHAPSGLRPRPAPRPPDHPEGQHLLAPALPLGEQHSLAAGGGGAHAARGRLSRPARAPQPDRGHRRAPGRQAQQVRRRLPPIRGADGRQLLARVPLGDDRAQGAPARPRPHLRRGARARGDARERTWCTCPRSRPTSTPP